MVQGLTKEDFTLLDEGKPQPIAVFSAGRLGDAKPVDLPPGAISNRQDSRGRPLNGATVVFVDLLNTYFDLTDYARLGLKNVLRSLNESDGRVAVYTLGRNLHLLHDFDDDPQKLREIAATLEQPHGKLPADLDSAFRDFGDLMDLGRDEARCNHLESPGSHPPAPLPHARPQEPGLADGHSPADVCDQVWWEGCAG
jgi:VWFA-related protein